MSQYLPECPEGYYLIHLPSAQGKHPIFRSIFAYNAFLGRLGQAQHMMQTNALAYALFQDEIILLSQVKWPIEHWVDAWSLAYSRWSHRVHDHQGSVFADQFHAIHVQPQVLTDAIGYVHTAVILKGIQSMLDYPWSSHAAYEGEANTVLKWLDVAGGLHQFHQTPQIAQHRYSTFMQGSHASKHHLRQLALHGNDQDLRRWQARPTVTTTITGKPKEQLTSQNFDHLCQFDRTLDQAVRFAELQLKVPAEAILGFSRHHRTADARAIAAWIALQETVPKDAIAQYFEIDWPILEGQIRSTQARMGDSPLNELQHRWHDELKKA